MVGAFDVFEAKNKKEKRKRQKQHKKVHFSIYMCRKRNVYRKEEKLK